MPLSRYFLSLVFVNLAITGLDVEFFWFILFGVWSASWICRFMPFANLGSFQSLFLRLLVPALLSFSSPSRTPNDTNVRSFAIVPCVLEEHLFFHSIFSLFGSGNFYCSIFKLVRWFFPLSSPFCCWAYPLSFLFFVFWLLYFSVLNSHFIFLYICYFFPLTFSFFMFQVGWRSDTEIFMWCLL